MKKEANWQEMACVANEDYLIVDTQVKVRRFGLVNPKRYIKFEGRKTIAKMVARYYLEGKPYDFVKTATAKCHPNDKYIKSLGIDLAQRRCAIQVEKECIKLMLDFTQTNPDPLKRSSGYRHNTIVAYLKSLKKSIKDTSNIPLGLIVDAVKYRNNCFKKPLPERELYSIVNQIFK